MTDAGRGPVERWRLVVRTCGASRSLLALLLFVVFPWVEPRLPFDDVTVGE